jgi:hypothetical protein
MISPMQEKKYNCSNKFSGKPGNQCADKPEIINRMSCGHVFHFITFAIKAQLLCKKTKGKCK